MSLNKVSDIKKKAANVIALTFAAMVLFMALCTIFIMQVVMMFVTRLFSVGQGIAKVAEKKIEQEFNLYNAQNDNVIELFSSVSVR